MHCCINYAYSCSNNNKLIPFNGEAAWFNGLRLNHIIHEIIITIIAIKSVAATITIIIVAISSGASWEELVTDVSREEVDNVFVIM